ncbi:flagellar basal body P-ring formation chaperone FlgA [Pectobacteriaceae bacterium CE70]|nr:flagellar basal body P-ring formation chaperone FlgA [Pectobacteriaceae bacterium C52]WJV68594.1 flagellar basal body P-ring formation chaperone FlgA [Pectobacteriaceae bacterium CE70]
MKFNYRLALISALFFALSTAVHAADLSSEITSFMKSQVNFPAAEVKVNVKTPLESVPSCENPQFSLPSRRKVWGNISIKVTCGTQKHFIQAYVQVTAPYVVAAKPIVPRHEIKAGDVTLQRGRLDSLLGMPLSDPSLAIGSISIRMIGAGQPISSRMLRKVWSVKMGEIVKVVALGSGFSITSIGKVIDNAAINDNVRVRMDSGQIVSGIVRDKGLVEIAQ